MEQLLKDVWAGVASDYAEDRLNSEHALQASLYYWFRELNTEERLGILVEPDFVGKPDMVLVGKDSVRCVIEIKHTPHYWLDWPKTRRDIDKLLTTFKKKIFQTRLLGPTHYYDYKNKRLPANSKWRITEETFYVFALITRYDDESAFLGKIQERMPELTRVKNFVQLRGETFPDRSVSNSRFRFLYERIGHQARLVADSTSMLGRKN